MLRSLVFALLCPLSFGVTALELSGPLEQGGMLIGRVEPGEKLELMGRPIRVEKDGVFVFGLGRDAPSQIDLITRNASDEAKHHRFDVQQRTYQEQRVNGVPQKTVTPPKEVLERIRREAALVAKARADDDLRLDFLAGFRKPLEGPITGVYGSRRVYNGTPGNPHYGLDIAAPTGAEVFAPAPGVVKLAYEDMFYSGGTLIIDHGHGISSTFIHLSEVLVKAGQTIAPGDLIARVGATGRATGPHLDWRINWFDVRLDPALVLEHFPARKALSR
ncbi:M23 family metallopeptidase [Porticoccus sp.]